ncbi:MAG: beta family protein [Dehalococcoidales bacterium]|nr:beta family protein [Dehalococcoidales bacterium]
MVGFGVNHYVPILKGKLGEFKAIGELTAEVKDQITPLFEVPPIPINYDTGKPAKSVDTHIKNFIPNINKYWGTGRSAFVDLNFIPDKVMKNGQHPLNFVFQQARDLDLSLIPVIGLYRQQEYLSAVKEINNIDHRGVCIRIEPVDIENEDLDELILTLEGELEVDVSEVDILIDLKEIQKDQIGLLVRSVRDVIRTLPNIDEWRTLTLVATAFPQTMSGFEPNSISLTARAEWQLWTTLFYNSSKIPRMPTFGDYTVVHPELLEIDPRYMQLGSKIKYTYDNDWIIVKGTSIRRGGSDQTRHLCRDLIALDEYLKQEFSWGDRYIQECADEIAGVGSQTTWVSVGVNHHITFVVNQLRHYGI